MACQSCIFTSLLLIPVEYINIIHSQEMDKESGSSDSTMPPQRSASDKNTSAERRERMRLLYERLNSSIHHGQSSGTDGQYDQQRVVPPEYTIYHRLYNAYIGYHGYVATTICAFGIVANALNIKILSHKSLRTPINMMLQLVACSDLGLMAMYLTYCTRYYIQDNDLGCTHQSVYWAGFAWAYANSSQLLHGFSIWIAVVMAVLRVYMLHGSSRGKGTQHYFRVSRLSAVGVAGGVVVFAIPHVLSFSVARLDLTCHTTEGEPINYTFTLRPSAFNIATGGVPLIMSFWIVGIMFKAVPCTILMLCISMLVRTLRQAQARRARLKHSGGGSTRTHTLSNATAAAAGAGGVHANNLTAVTDVGLNNSLAEDGSLTIRPDAFDSGDGLGGGHACSRMPDATAGGGGRGGYSAHSAHLFRTLKAGISVKPSRSAGTHKVVSSTPSSGSGGSSSLKRERNTTVLLVLVLLIFITTQLPQALLTLITGLHTTAFREHVYNNLAEITDILSLINASSTFILYCSMSKQFRAQFQQQFACVGRAWSDARSRTSLSRRSSSKRTLRHDLMLHENTQALANEL